MLSVSDLKKHRGEWLRDDLRHVMMDSADCVYVVSHIYGPSNDGMGCWVLAWVIWDNPFCVPQVAGSPFKSAEAAKSWVDAGFADHFNWFDSMERAA